jgi:thiamine pyrophosphate-dependent acetolactate synthase large subunit-like protein
VEENVAVIWVIMNNGAYGTIAGLQKAHYGTTVGAIFHKRDGEPYSPDYAALPAGGPVKRAGFVPKKYNGTVQSP